MNYYYLKDTDTGEVDAIIISKTSTAEEIENAIYQMKVDTDWDYQWVDLEECLPDDCEIICTQWGVENVWY